MAATCLDPAASLRGVASVVHFGAVYTKAVAVPWQYKYQMALQASVAGVGVLGRRWMGHQ